VVRLEIGPLAEWMPSHTAYVEPFAAERYPQIFEKTKTRVLVIDAERTFWEKITILHKLANYPEDKAIPPRYARHLYDVYRLSNSWVKGSAFQRKELLKQDVSFKQKFYYSKSAHYDTASLDSIALIPANHILSALEADYKAMSNMIYGDIPGFQEILEYLKVLEAEIHSL